MHELPQFSGLSRDEKNIGSDIFVTGYRFVDVFPSAVSVRQAKWTVSQGHVIGEGGTPMNTSRIGLL